MFVTALPPPPGGYVGRWEDALLGGAVALAVAFALPADPRRGPRQEADHVAHVLARALHRSADAARAGSAEEAHAALELARSTEPDLRAWRDAVSAGAEISRISPLRRRARAEISTHRDAVAPVDRAVRNLRVALRRMESAVEDAYADRTPAPAPASTPASTVPAHLLDRLDELAGAVHTLPGALRDRDGEGGRRAIAAFGALAARLDPAELADSLSTTVVVAQMRSAVVDLLQVPGLTQDEARALLPH